MFDRETVSSGGPWEHEQQVRAFLGEAAKVKIEHDDEHATDGKERAISRAR
jgi:hypothetical protein